MEKVAIIIVNYCHRKFLPELFASVFQNKPLTVEQTVVFIDNASNDDSVTWVTENYPETIVLPQRENLGFAGGNNVGIKYAKEHDFDYVFLLNPDTVITDGCLDKLVADFKNNPLIGAIQPRLMLGQKPELLNSFGCVIHYLGFGYTWGNGKKWQEKSIIKEVNYCSGAACLMPIKVLNKVGWFDENLFVYHEDLDLGWRLKLLGYKNLADSDAVVYHCYEFSRSIKKLYFMERNRLIVLLKNYKIKTLLLILPALLVIEIGLILFAIKGGWLKEKLKAYVYFFSFKNWQKILKSRKAIQKDRKVTDRQVAKDFSGLILHQETDNILLRLIGNPLLNLYWLAIKKMIIW